MYVELPRKDVRLSVLPQNVWWACKGTRRPSPGDVGEVGDAAWVDCDGCEYRTIFIFLTRYCCCRSHVPGQHLVGITP